MPVASNARPDESRDSHLPAIPAREALLLAIAVAVGVGIGFWVGWHRQSQATIDRLEEVAALVAAGFVDTRLGELGGGPEDIENPLHERVRMYLARAREAKPDLRFVYLFRRLGPSSFVFIADSEAPDSPDYSPPGAPMDVDTDRVFLAGIASGEPFFSPAYEDAFGRWVSATAPVASPDGVPRHFVGVDASAASYTREAFVGGTTYGVVGAVIVLLPGMLVLRQRRDQRHAQGQRRLATAIQHGGEPVFVADADGRLLWSNRAFQRLVGEVGPGWDSGKLPERWDLDGTEASEWRSIVERGREGEVECSLAVTGERRRFRWRFTVLRSPVGRVEETLAIGRDITEEHRATLALRESEERFRLVLESCPDGFWDTRYDKEESFLSPRWRAILGYPAEELRVGVDAWMDLLHPEDRDDLRWGISRLRPPGRAQFRHRFRMRHRDGHWIWIEATGIEIRGESGLLVRSLGFHRDVSEEVLLHERLQQALASAEESAAAAQAADRAKTVFLATMGHEIRTPLNGILGFAALLQEYSLEDEPREFIGIIKHNGEALLSLLDQVLDYARLEGGKPRLEHVEMDLVPLIEGIFDLFGPTASERGLRLCWAVAPEVPLRLLADPVRLRQVLVNLVGNAVKFTEIGGVDLLVTASAVEEDGKVSVRFEISDTGAGIPEDRRHLLFKPFSQVDGSLARKHGGTGLGLAIVRSIVEAFGGRLGVDAREGGGSRFWVEVPLVVVRAALGEPPSAAPGVAVDIPGDPVARASIGLQLRRLGVRVVPEPEAVVVFTDDSGSRDGGSLPWVQVRFPKGVPGRAPTVEPRAIVVLPCRQRDLVSALLAVGIRLRLPV